jgi:hypothetical protein
VYAAKTSTVYIPPHNEKASNHDAELLMNGLFPVNRVENHVCPYCHQLDFTEYTEAKPEIVSVKSVPLEDVDDWLAKGYQVESLYAKTATLSKRGEVG